MAVSSSSVVVQQPGYLPEGNKPPVISDDAHVGDGPPGQGTLTFYGTPPPDYS